MKDNFTNLGLALILVAFGVARGLSAASYTVEQTTDMKTWNAGPTNSVAGPIAARLHLIDAPPGTTVGIGTITILTNLSVSMAISNGDAWFTVNLSSNDWARLTQMTPTGMMGHVNFVQQQGGK